MKALLLLSLSIISLNVWPSQELNTIAETVNCEEKIVIKGKAGEKFVYALYAGQKIKLTSEDGSAYKKDSPQRVTFTNSMEKDKGPKVSFIMPAFMENNAPKVEIVKSEKSHKCSLKLK